MTLSIRTKLSAAFAVALLLILETGAYSWSSTASLVDNALLVDHTHEVLQNLEGIVSQLKDAETGQRGFVITGEDHYLEPYRAGLEGVEDAVAAVGNLTLDNPSQQRRLEVAKLHIQSKLSELNRTIYLRRNAGFDRALEVIPTDSGQRSMDDLRSVVAEMAHEESQLQQRRAAASASTAKKTKFAVVFGTLVSSAIFGIVALFLFLTNSKLEYEVRQRMRTEQELEEQTQELARSNQELEKFAHIASHDLQEPLRMVSSYTQLLERRYKDKLDSDANEFIAYAVDGAKRMQTQINDLLAYSRVTSQGHSMEATDCSAIFQNAIANLAGSIEESGAVVTQDPLPTVPADDSQLTSVFQNLIGNGIKYRGEQAPQIHVSAVESGDEWMFSISDNGIGIDPQFAERIFEIFQRLHSKEEYAGTGIGLAICKKVVERHGGRIWVESEPGTGSTFWFTLPRGIEKTETLEVSGYQGA